MTIIFSQQERELIEEKLAHAGLYSSDSRIEGVLHNVEAAFQQQFNEEASYMIREFEAS